MKYLGKLRARIQACYNDVVTYWDDQKKEFIARENLSYNEYIEAKKLSAQLEVLDQLIWAFKEKVKDKKENAA